MREQVELETCDRLHQLGYFGNIRTVRIDGETFVAHDTDREINEKIPMLKPPRLHDIYLWLKKTQRVKIRIECLPKFDLLRQTQESSIWRYSVTYKKETIISKRGYNQYGDALDGAIVHALTLI